MFVSLSAGLALTLGTAAAQTFDVNNTDTNLSDAGAWTPQNSNGQNAPPNASGGAVFDQNEATNPSNLNFNFTTSSSTAWNSIETTTWTDLTGLPVANTVFINSGLLAPSNSNVLTITGSSTGITTENAALTIGNLNVDPELGPIANQSATTFDLQSALTITGALGTAKGNSTTVIVNDGGPLNLVGNSNSGSIKTNGGQTSGNVNLSFQNNSAITLGGNQTQTFGQLTINGNTTLNEDFASSSTTAFNNQLYAISTKTQETFTGGLNITNGTLTIYGWQGPQLGATSSGGQLLFDNAGNTLALGTEVKNVIFDLASNQAGPTGSNYVSPGSNLDYGEWIADPLNSSLDELVPYDCVPEPATVFAGVALLSALAWRERRRLADLFTPSQDCI
jgi:hypothetical protein